LRPNRFGEPSALDPRPAFGDGSDCLIAADFPRLVRCEKRHDGLILRRALPVHVAGRTKGAGAMAKGQKKSNKEARKPKKEVKKVIAANPSTKGSVSKSD
jgi:hypothetical protein